MHIRQSIAFVTASDGARIASASWDAGRSWCGQLTGSAMSDMMRTARSGGLGCPRCRVTAGKYLRYDQRGCGLSDRDETDFSLDAMVADLEVVTAPLGPTAFPLVGMSQGAR